MSYPLGTPLSFFEYLWFISWFLDVSWQVIEEPYSRTMYSFLVFCQVR